MSISVTEISKEIPADDGTLPYKGIPLTTGHMVWTSSLKVGDLQPRGWAGDVCANPTAYSGHLESIWICIFYIFFSDFFKKCTFRSHLLFSVYIKIIMGIRRTRIIGIYRLLSSCCLYLAQVEAVLSLPLSHCSFHILT